MTDATARRRTPHSLARQFTKPLAAWKGATSAAALLGAFLLVASAAVAGVLVSYNTSSTATLTLKAPPVQWSAGPDSSGNNYVASWSLSSNQTYWSMTLKPVPEASITWENLTTLSNTDSAAYTVSVSGTDLSGYSSYITAATLAFYNYGDDAPIGTLDLTSGNALNLGSMAAGANYYVRANIQLADGVGQQNLPASVSVTLSITP